MLQTTLRCLIPIYFLTLLLTVGSVLASKDTPQPDTEYWSQFGFNACAMPCFAGITPGETPFNNAATLVANYLPALRQQILVSSSQAIFFGEDSATGASLTGIARYIGGKVGEIRLTLTRTLVDVLLRFGSPDCTLAYPPGNAEYLYLYWEDEGSVFWASVTVNSYVDFESQVFTITSTTLEDAAVCSSNTATEPWRGFAPMWVYNRG